MRKLERKRGFTLVELIVVLVVLAVLAAILVPTLIGYIEQARHQKDYATAAALEQAAQSVVIEQQQEVRGGKQWSYENLNPVASSDGMRTKGKAERDEVLELAGVDTSQVKWFHFNISRDGAVTPMVVAASRNAANTPAPLKAAFPTCVCIDDTVYYMQRDGSWASAKLEGNSFETSVLDVYTYPNGTMSQSQTTWNPADAGLSPLS